MVGRSRCHCLYRGLSPAVLRELEDPETPEAVRTWVTHPPTWFERRAPQQPPAETAFPALGAGEREAIVGAKGVQADFVLIDERDGRRVARSLTLAVIGTLGVLEEAAVRGLLDLPRALARLQANHLLCITSLV